MRSDPREHPRVKLVPAALMALCLTLCAAEPASQVTDRRDSDVASTAVDAQFTQHPAFGQSHDRVADSGVTPAETRRLYLWSSLAQSLAALTALVFAATFVVAQLIVRYGLKRAEALFGPWNIAKPVIFLSAVAAPLLALHFNQAAFSYASVVLAAASGVLLVVHFLEMKAKLSMKTEVSRLQRSAQRELGEACSELGNIAYGAIESLDFGTLEDAVRALTQLAVAGPRGKPVEDSPAFVKLKEVILAGSDRPVVLCPVVQGVAMGQERATGESILGGIASATDYIDRIIGDKPWPQYESVYSAYFRALSLVHARLLRVKQQEGPDWKAAVEAAVQHPLTLLETAGKRCGYSGSGEAWLAFVETYTDCAKKAAAVDSSRPLARQCVRAVFGFTKQGWSGQSRQRTARAYERIYQMYRDVAKALDDNDPSFPEVSMVVEAGRPDLIADTLRVLVDNKLDRHVEAGLNQIAAMIKDGLKIRGARRLVAKLGRIPARELCGLPHARLTLSRTLGQIGTKLSGSDVCVRLLSNYMRDVAREARSIRDPEFKLRLLLSAEVIRNGPRVIANSVPPLTDFVLGTWFVVGAVLYAPYAGGEVVPRNVQTDVDAIGNSVQGVRDALNGALARLRHDLIVENAGIEPAMRAFVSAVRLIWPA